jgi:hypothetical protein
MSRIDQLKRAGLIRPARKAPHHKPLPKLFVSDDARQAMLAEVDAESDPYDY